MYFVLQIMAGGGSNASFTECFFEGFFEDFHCCTTCPCPEQGKTLEVSRGYFQGQSDAVISFFGCSLRWSHCVTSARAVWGTDATYAGLSQTQLLGDLAERVPRSSKGQHLVSVAFYLGPTGESTFGSCPRESRSDTLAESDAFLSGNGAQETDYDIRKGSKTVEIAFGEAPPAAAVRREALEMLQSLERSFSAKTIQRPEQHQIKAALRCISE